MALLTLEEATEAVDAALRRAGAGEVMAASTARALVLAEAQGITSHGLSRVAQYATHLRNGRVDGSALPEVQRHRGAALLVDAHSGLAFPACDLAVHEAIEAARRLGVAFAGVCNSHHCGVLVDHLRPVAAAGMVGLAFANSPAAMPATGGRHPIFGTNPVAAAFPRHAARVNMASPLDSTPSGGGLGAVQPLGHTVPLMVDLSLSEVARGKLMVAAKEGRGIPLGWALDAEGEPTTDPAAGLQGSMLPIGATTSPKGAMLALVVELLVTALIGAQFGFEASSFFVDAGNRPRIGQAFLVIDPQALAGSNSYLERVEVLLAEMLKDDGVRLPGARREALRRQAEREGLQASDAMLAGWG